MVEDILIHMCYEEIFVCNSEAFASELLKNWRNVSSLLIVICGSWTNDCKKLSSNPLSPNDWLIHIFMAG